jgi:hypothetical protein
MPRGSAPGERRGGRAKGTPDKVTVARQAAMAAAVADCFASMTDAQIEALKPKEIMLRAMHTAAKNGDSLLAVSIAERAAPYYDAKITGPVNIQGRLTLEQLVLGVVTKEEEEVRRSGRETQSQSPSHVLSQHTSEIPALPAAGLLEDSEIRHRRPENRVSLHAVDQPSVPALPRSPASSS